MKGYIYIFFLISLASVCHTQESSEDSSEEYQGRRIPGRQYDKHGIIARERDEQGNVCGSGCDREETLASCRRRCALECERTWDNGRKTCCEGSGNPEKGGVWSRVCNSGIIDMNMYVL